MYNDWATKRGAMDFYCAISGIEHALGWFAYQQFPSRRIRTPEQEGP